MSASLQHDCDKCGESRKIDECFCRGCYDDFYNQGYDDGYKQAKKDFEQ